MQRPKTGTTFGGDEQWVGLALGAYSDLTSSIWYVGNQLVLSTSPGRAHSVFVRRGGLLSTKAVLQLQVLARAERVPCWDNYMIALCSLFPPSQVTHVPNRNGWLLSGWSDKAPFTVLYFFKNRSLHARTKVKTETSCPLNPSTALGNKASIRVITLCPHGFVLYTW